MNCERRGPLGKAPYLEVVAETELQGLGGQLDVALQEMDLRHEEEGIGEGRVLIQTVLEAALSCVDVPCSTPIRKEQ